MNSALPLIESKDTMWIKAATWLRWAKGERSKYIVRRESSTLGPQVQWNLSLGGVFLAEF